MILLLLGTIGLLVFFLIKNIKTLKELEKEFNDHKAHYKGIIDVDKEIFNKTKELNAINQSISSLTFEFTVKKEELNEDFKSKRTIYENLLNEISILEESLEDISYGLYKPHFEYSTSQEYQQKLTEIRDKQKQVIRNEQATLCITKWTVEGSEAKGRKMIKDSSKLMLRAFNGECDAAIAKVSWNNVSNMEARINKAYEALNKLGSVNHITITGHYLSLKLNELFLEFELEQKIHEEKEEQREIREQMREEEKALRELEKAQRDAEAEEVRYQKALEKARTEIQKATGSEFDKLNEKIKQLEANLEKAHLQKERAISQAQLTKSGHVYIISNIGSFGENVFKIGMTRRLQPMDRVHELGDASVPFDFDVHGMIYSENAPNLENTLHRHLENKRVNLMNRRAEFFNTNIEEIEMIMKEYNLSIQLTKLAEAREYRETISIREANKTNQTEHKTEIEKQLEKIPISLEL